MAEAESPQRADHTAALATCNALATLRDASVSGVMLVEQRKNEPLQLHQLWATGEAELALNEVVRAATIAYSDCELIAYGPAAVAGDGQVMWIDATQVPLLLAVIEESSDLANMPLYDPGVAELRNLRLAAIRADANGVSAVFLQSLRGSQIVARSRTRGFLLRRGVIDTPKDGELVLLRQDVAVVVVGQIAFFKDRAVFQRLCGYLDELREKAAATFDSVTRNLQIQGWEEMRGAASGSTPMLGKMASIQQKLDRYPKYKDALTMPRILQFIGEHPECGVEVAGTGDSAKLVFRSDPQHRFKILKLLDDDYLRSELTDLEYEANSKSAPLGEA